MPIVVHKIYLLPPPRSTTMGDSSERAKDRTNPQKIVISCTFCSVYADDKKALRKCSKCKSAFYCSRECQKKDWARHRANCTPASAQRDYVSRLFLKIQKDEGLIANLRTAIACTILRETRDPKRIWIAVANLVLKPANDEHLKSLMSRDVPLESLAEVKMPGVATFTSVMDVSDPKLYPLNGRFREYWRQHREMLESVGRPESLTVLVQFAYELICIFIAPVEIGASDFSNAERELGSSFVPPWGVDTNTTILRRINIQLAAEPAHCDLSPLDKEIYREWATGLPP
ncbi:unnamed protein product [Cyclocybe aegerita]|uniref:MYND-type domain-containing protein n=1 Tax=Cyclocybe aegerita TaxID=1973307 RepID=A0A8S0W075_CYCAE|nr:unnamed protein product [Cyclocybe aegerita]